MSALRTVASRRAGMSPFYEVFYGPVQGEGRMGPFSDFFMRR